MLHGLSANAHCFSGLVGAGSARDFASSLLICAGAAAPAGDRLLDGELALLDALASNA
jgi:hypothetical protein